MSKNNFPAHVKIVTSHTTETIKVSVRPGNGRKALRLRKSNDLGQLLRLESAFLSIPGNRHLVKKLAAGETINV
jgi:hypothetical protein